MFIMTLELEVISYMRWKILKITTIPYHSDFIYNDNGIRRNFLNSYILIGYLVSTGTVFCRIDIPSFFEIIQSIYSAALPAGRINRNKTKNIPGCKKRLGRL